MTRSETLSDHPTPDRRRSAWLSLNGEWSFRFDDDELGLAQRWHERALETEQRIVVPFAFQTKASGVHEPAGQHEVVWYSRSFSSPARKAQRTLLHFGAVDYEATVWIDGQRVAHHVGGHSPFHADITDALAHGTEEHLIVVRAEDRPDQDQPRGKQTWQDKPGGIWYTPTTGIWQTVWLETVSPTHIDATSLAVTTDYDAGSIRVEADVVTPRAAANLTLEMTVSLRGKLAARSAVAVRRGIRTSVTATIGDASKEIMWSPDGSGVRSLFSWVGFEAWTLSSPTLYDLELRLVDAQGGEMDRVLSYCGMRKVSIENGQLCLNGRPFYQKLVLDQVRPLFFNHNEELRAKKGYYPNSGLTAPSDEAMRQDILLAKSMGFNGCRKHQKPEDPRWLYHADVLGYLVWAEFADCYGFTPRAVERTHAEWPALVRRDLGHPSIVTWLIVNEGWGVPSLQTDPRQRDHLVSLVHLTKSIDLSRMIVASDGWLTIEQSDLCTLHDYTPLPAMLKRWPDVASRLGTEKGCTDFDGGMGHRPFALGHRYRGQPVILSECGGIAVKSGDGDGWGYNTTVKSGDELLGLMERYVEGVFPHVQGFCWTQLTDVETEVNGLLDKDRKPKVDPAKLKAILDKLGQLRVTVE